MNRQEMRQEMYNAIKEVIGSGYIKEYYIDMMRDFVDIAEHYADCKVKESAATDLLEALERFVENYVDMVNSGDCGNWNPETEVKVINARAAIAKARGNV